MDQRKNFKDNILLMSYQIWKLPACIYLAVLFIIIILKIFEFLFIICNLFFIAP